MRRIKGFQIAYLLLLMVLCGRLYYIQVLCGQELTMAAQGQQMIPVVQENSKGNIYDRNMRMLTGTSRAYYYLIHKDNLTAEAERLLQKMNAIPAGQKGKDYLVYRTTNYSSSASQILQSKLQAYGFSVETRFDEKQIARPLLTDLDEMYSGVLQSDEPGIYFLGNATGNLVKGVGISTQLDSAALITSLDKAMQTTVEGIFEETSATGCAVIVDTNNGQILTMVSNDIENRNLAIEKARDLSSADWIISEAAQIFDVDYLEAANALGFGKPVFLDYPGEDCGNIATTKASSVTAVQLCQALTTLANGGEKKPLVLVMSTVQDDSIPCMELNEDRDFALQKMQNKLTQNPLSGDGWAAGYGGTAGQYAVVVWQEGGKAKRLYDSILDVLNG